MKAIVRQTCMHNRFVTYGELIASASSAFMGFVVKNLVFHVGDTRASIPALIDDVKGKP